MLDLISIHIPKTAGTSFYAILKQVYGEELSAPFRRRDILNRRNNEYFDANTLPPHIRILHGHFYYSEIANLHRTDRSKLVCWLREPVERLISNYLFFKAGLENPERNPEQYELNKHRLNESLLEYAERLENRNRISEFLHGSNLEDFFFCGRMSHYEEDIRHLGRQLGWPPNLPIPTLNRGAKQSHSTTTLSTKVLYQLEEWNSEDLALYRRFLANIDRSTVV